jgi:hypothetical protein
MKCNMEINPMNQHKGKVIESDMGAGAIVWVASEMGRDDAGHLGNMAPTQCLFQGYEFFSLTRLTLLP